MKPQQPKAAPTNNQNSLDDLFKPYESLRCPHCGHKSFEIQFDEAKDAINKTIMEAEARAKIEGAYEQLVSLRMDVLQVNPDHTKASTLMVIDQSIRQLEPKLSEAFWEAQLFPTKKYGRADNG